MTSLEQEYRQRHEDFLRPVAVRLEAFIRDCIADLPRIDRVTARPKAVDRFLQKAAKDEDGHPKYADPLNQIQDQIGARIVTYYTDDVDIVSHAVEAYLRPIEFRTVVPDSESEFSYFGRHYIMLLPKDVLVDGETVCVPFFELQIKTLFQHAWGEANHDLGYKPGSPLTLLMRRKLAFASAQAWGADLIFNELHQEAAGKKDP
jgi:ppGpp synthetase/RelA/SpoT-type nucleotidyltranferase